METKDGMALSDSEIIEGLRHRDPRTTRDYFYGSCRVAYSVYNRRYNLEWKTGLDFYSIAHEYYLALDKHGFRQLEDRKPGMSLKTWMVNGFRFVLLDRLKAYNREHRVQSFEERMEKADVRFDLPDNNFTQDFRNTVLEICHNVLGRDSRSSIILQMMLIGGFKGKEVAEQLHITPSAVSQQYHRLMEDVVVPYFKRYYSAPEVMAPMPVGAAPDSYGDDAYSGGAENYLYIPQTMHTDYSNRITPERITQLQPGEIFVFGSNLAGMHGGGAASLAFFRFGAVMGNGDGPQGQSYAIPTMQGGVETIRPYVDKFISYAKTHPEQTFLVTAIGCGIAGFTPEEIAPLFSDAKAVDNIHLPLRFWQVIA